jgi:cytochrome c-type biogenesis protein CcmH/NrfG
MRLIARLRDKIKAMANPSQRTFRIVLASVGLLALAWQHIEATRLGYQVETARKRVHTLQGRLGALRMDLETTLSPAQLAHQARTKLNMQPASPESLRLLGTGAASQVKDSILSRLFGKSWLGRAPGLDT